jgi:hypothetical protein
MNDDDMVAKIKALSRDQLEKIAEYAAAGLWLRSDGLYDPNKEVSSACDFMELVYEALDDAGLVPPEVPEEA